MLSYEQTQPQKLAYDRPSPKLFQFLKKYYGLAKFVSQNNNYVIFDDYFVGGTPAQQQTQQKDLGAYQSTIPSHNILFGGWDSNQKQKKYENKSKVGSFSLIPVKREGRAGKLSRGKGVPLLNDCTKKPSSKGRIIPFAQLKSQQGNPFILHTLHLSNTAGFCQSGTKHHQQQYELPGTSTGLTLLVPAASAGQQRKHLYCQTASHNPTNSAA